MKQVRETQLPGVGIRHEFSTVAGQTIGVISYHGGSHDIVAYDDEDDPDVCTASLHLNGDETHLLGELLGASQVTSTVQAVEQHIDGLAIEWIRLTDASRLVGTSIGAGEIRRRTGVSIVAVQRQRQTIPAPDANFVLDEGDVLVAVGTAEGLGRLTTILTGE